MYALPPAPAPAPRRQVLVGTAVGGAAATMFFGGMLAVWLRFRNAAPLITGSKGTLIRAWLPKGVRVHQVAANIMLLTMVIACVMAQLAVYAAKRADRSSAGIGFGLAGLLGLATLNAQAFEYGQMGVKIRKDGAAGTMFYGITGAFVLVLIVLLLMTLLTAFRFFGGRSNDREVVASLALSWYLTTGLFAAVWFVVYVIK